MTATATPMEYLCVILPASLLGCAILAYLVQTGFLFMQSIAWKIEDEKENNHEK